MNSHTTRETWLVAAARELIDRCHIAPRGPWRVTCGWPSRRATALRARVLGQCFDPLASADGTIEIIVTIGLDDPIEVLGVLAHELIHAHLPAGTGHRRAFAVLAWAIGLDGKPTATTVGPTFRAVAEQVLGAIGAYPHGRLNALEVPKDGTRMIRARCATCGYTVRLTRKWLALAIPHCPVDRIEMVVG